MAHIRRAADREDIRGLAGGVLAAGERGGGLSPRAADGCVLDRIAKNRVLLAPLAGITDSAFRVMCAKGGAGLTYTEMISAKGIGYRNIHTVELLDLAPEEGQVGVQLFGSEPEDMAEAACFAADRLGDRLAVIDINMGCPVRKIFTNGEGCALMDDLPRAAAIIGAVRRAAEVPLSVKFRKGSAGENAVELARIAEDCGADLVVVHGRTREQMYEGSSDPQVIAAVKAAVSIPVVGNGDVKDGPTAKALMERTGCDAVMIGRGALGDPGIFRRIVSYLETGEEQPEPCAGERIALAIEHARLCVREKGEHRAVRELRKHAAWYIKGLRGAAAMRTRLVRAETMAELEALLLEMTDEKRRESI